MTLAETRAQEMLLVRLRRCREEGTISLELRDGAAISFCPLAGDWVDSDGELPLELAGCADGSFGTLRDWLERSVPVEVEVELLPQTVALRGRDGAAVSGMIPERVLAAASPF